MAAGALSLARKERFAGRRITVDRAIRRRGLEHIEIVDDCVELGVCEREGRHTCGRNTRADQISKRLP
jgi:hypothetical protein